MVWSMQLKAIVIYAYQLILIILKLSFCLLQADSKTVQSVAQWTGTSFAADEDGKVAAKFRKLMGIREEDKALLDDNVDLSKLTEEQRQRQEELFAQLDKEYAFARMTTHTCRGVGLGFQSQGLPDT